MLEQSWIGLGMAVGGGLIAWGALRAETRGLRRDVDEKASREIVDAHYQEIITRLDRIEKRVNNNA